jgi:Domain of unknown function (DUF397)
MSNPDAPRTVWRKSSYSGGNGGCIEVAGRGGRIVVRDSKDPSGSVLVFSLHEMRVFLESEGRQAWPTTRRTSS